HTHTILIMAAWVRLTALSLLLKSPRSMASIRIINNKKPPKNRSSLLMLFVAFSCVSYQLFQSITIVVCGKTFQDVERFLLIYKHLGSRVLHAAVCFDKCNNFAHLFGVFVVVFYQV